MENNNALTALAVAESIIPQLQCGSRMQLRRGVLVSLDKSIAQVLSSLSLAGLNDGIISSNLVASLRIIKGVLDDDTVEETDLITKNALVDKILPAVDRLYLKVGEYYTVNDFAYTPRLQKLLNRLVDKCVAAGMYFGVDEEVI